MQVDHILFVDDDEATLFYHQMMAEESGVTNHIITARNGDQGMLRIKELITHHHNENTLVFMDINMPAINGWDVIESLEKMNKEVFKNIHIYMTSAADHPRDIERINQHLIIKGFVSKPITAEKIITLTQ